MANNDKKKSDKKSTQRCNCCPTCNEKNIHTCKKRIDHFKPYLPENKK